MRFMVRSNTPSHLQPFVCEFSDDGVNWKDAALYPEGTPEQRALYLLMRSGLRLLPGIVLFDIEEGLVRVEDEHGVLHPIRCQQCGLENCGEGPPPLPALNGGRCPECGEADALRFAFDCVGCVVTCVKCGWDEVDERERARREAEETNR